MSLNEFQQKVLKHAGETKGHGGHAARSCARHLERAWQLRNTMPELAVFSALTAQEEAAVSIFCALRKHRYDNSDKIDYKNHVHKTGVYQFIRLVGAAFIPPDTEINIELYFDQINEDNKKQILKIRMPVGLSNDQKICIIPEPPLGIISTDPDGNKKDYHKETNKIATESGIKSILDYVKKLANKRNQVLYASPSSVPSITDAEATIIKLTNESLFNMVMYLLIEPHKKQELVQEALNAYVKILKRISVNET